eukprot:gnl/TRDRNA2_/TRDRNA2_184292_c0_seq1.p2 gnl/TRDRNA2_/TRDRNA2_184292_c0~~gnl/TRDRNA2_/TRDRNA2_184292_c0_seq1.p2  ORF type:complete len:134 (+),score=45.34 gnl/TRDRNA2_/TRDRNA2_184292_c0_seq1:70-471(+)
MQTKARLLTFALVAAFLTSAAAAKVDSRTQQKSLLRNPDTMTREEKIKKQREQGVIIKDKSGKEVTYEEGIDHYDREIQEIEEAQAKIKSGKYKLKQEPPKEKKAAPTPTKSGAYSQSFGLAAAALLLTTLSA